MDASAEATTTPAEQEDPQRGLARLALVFGILPPAATIIGVIWASLSPGMEGVGVAIFALVIVIVLSIAALIVGIVAATQTKPRTFALIGIGLTVVNAIVVVLVFFPPWVIFA